MQKNVGGMDRNIRVIVGLAIIASGVVYESWWGAIGLIPIATGLLGWCPPYAIFGINTGKTKKMES